MIDFSRAPGGTWPLPVLGVVFVVWSSAACAMELGLPAQCELGQTCFIQQFPDVDVGSAAVDPFCGIATYDGHSGTDLRVRSMHDVRAGVKVVAVADGLVLRARDGEPDRLVQTDADRAAVADKECGNGLVVEHAEGYETQYCHLREGSLAVAPGDRVTKGQSLGEVGASGLAAFPHVHITVRKDGAEIDPATGRRLADGCSRDRASETPLFDAALLSGLGRGEPQLLDSGVTGGPVLEADLVRTGAPPMVTMGSAAVVGWAWLINLDKGDSLSVSLLAPDGSVVSEQAVPPLDRSKATYVAYAGRKRTPVPGEYRVKIVVKRGTDTLIDVTRPYSIQ